jgi:hypothetical protein
MTKENKTDWESRFREAGKSYYFEHMTDVQIEMSINFIRTLLAEQREEVIEKIKVIMDRQEIANGFQPRGYATEEQEKEIYFDGSDNGRDMMRIDLLNLIKNI